MKIFANVLYGLLSIGVCSAFATGMFFGIDADMSMRYARMLYFSFIVSIFFFPFTHKENNQAEGNYHPPIYSLLCIISNTPGNGSQILVTVLALLLIAMGVEVPKIIFGGN
jgi:hypothetical protein